MHSRRVVGWVVLALLGAACSTSEGEDSAAELTEGQSPGATDESSSEGSASDETTSDASESPPPSSADDTQAATDTATGSPAPEATGDEPDPTTVAAGACGNADGQLFPPEAPWNTPIADAPLDAESDAIIDYLASNHDTSTRFQADFSLRVLSADDSVEHVAFTPSDAFYEGDCDPAPMPLPEGGSLEGEDGYACESDGDCHLIVFDQDECRLFEMWRADIRGGDFNGGCMAVWDVDRVYGAEGRGDYCTSADAAGLPIAPLLFDADEVFAGEVKHAIRFILPNNHIREDIFVRPGTHSTGATSGPPTAPPYAARLRLKASTDLSELSPGAQVVARGLMEYGMILADGGNLTFTGRSDRDTTHSWDEAELTPQDLKGLSWTDFEVVELGERIAWSDGDCERDPVAE